MVHGSGYHQSPVMEYPTNPVRGGAMAICDMRRPRTACLRICAVCCDHVYPFRPSTQNRSPPPACVCTHEPEPRGERGEPGEGAGADAGGDLVFPAVEWRGERILQQAAGVVGDRAHLRRGGVVSGGAAVRAGRRVAQRPGFVHVPLLSKIWRPRCTRTWRTSPATRCI